jgi:hypothetical protein
VSDEAFTVSKYLRICAEDGVEMLTRIQREYALRKLTGSPLLGDKLQLNDHQATEEERQEILDAMQETPSSFFRAFGIQLSAAGYDLGDGKGQAGVQRYVDAHWRTRWAAHGLPVFSLTHSLAAALLLTDPPPFKPSELRLPFPAFAITLPPGFVPIRQPAGSKAPDGQGWCEAIRVHRLVGHTTMRRFDDLIHVDAVGHTARGLYRLKPVAELLNDDVTFLDLGPDIEPNIDADNHAFSIMLRLIRNLAAWVEAHGPGKHEGRPHPRGASYSRNAAGFPLPTTYILGREVKLGPELRRLASDIAVGKSDEKGTPRELRAAWKLRMRYCVRGHWRNQAHGEGHKDRRMTYIAPHWRGPEGAAAWQHIYVADEKKDEVA